MNERIRELADQLGPIATIGNWGRVEWTDNVYPQLGDQLYAAIDLQKFAELIVKECARVIDRGDGEMSSQVETIWCNVCRDDILKHFGVEE